MAVEARHLNLFPPQQLISNREFMTNNIDASIIQTGNFSSLLPFSGATTAASVPYNQLIADSLPQKTAAAMKSDSTLTYIHSNNNPVPLSRKRYRDSDYSNYHSYSAYRKDCNGFSFLGEDISLQIHNQHLAVDNAISQHMENVRVELEEKQRRQSRRLMEAIEIQITKRLKEKEEEIENIAKLNHALEERVKSLFIENQIWRDLAQTNEATANALRSNLEQVLAQIGEEGGGATVLPATADEDAESWCGSNEERFCTLAEGAQDKEGEGRRLLCRNCGKEESSVLILPCRHLCLCNRCGATVHTCPVCKSFKNASVHVNIS